MNTTFWIHDSRQTRVWSGEKYNDEGGFCPPCKNDEGGYVHLYQNDFYEREGFCLRWVLTYTLQSDLCKITYCRTAEYSYSLECIVFVLLLIIYNNKFILFCFRCHNSYLGFLKNTVCLRIDEQRPCTWSNLCCAEYSQTFWLQMTALFITDSF